MRASIILATCASLIALPGTVGAQGQSSPEGPIASDLKGPPNANGYGKETDTGPSGDTKAEAPSASKLKGPPNANGFQKQ